MTRFQTFDADQRDRQQGVVVHPDLAHLGAFVGGTSRWNATAGHDSASRPQHKKDGDELTGIAEVLLLADGDIDLIDLDAVAAMMRSVTGYNDATHRQAPTGDGRLGLAVAVAELRGFVDVGAITLEQYGAAAELLTLAGEWAAETAAEEALEADTHQASATTPSHRKAGGPALHPAARVPTSSTEHRRVLVRS